MVLRVKLPRGKIEECTLHDVLYVPDLAYNLLSQEEQGDNILGVEVRCPEEACC